MPFIRPDNARVWYLLARALHGAGDFELALDVHAHAAEFASVRANASYNAGCAAARLDRADEALEWLGKALEAGFSNTNLLLTDKDLDSLRNDARFQALLARGMPLDFVEDVQVLLELRGEMPGDRFGWIGRGTGDVDGDGFPDLFLSAPFCQAGGATAGRVYLYSGARGELLWKVDGQAGFRLGIAIESAGDLNGDGIPDQVAGASGAWGTGAAFAYSGLDGSLLFRWKGEAQGDQFGASVSGCGDVNGDGFDDVIVGAPYHDSMGQDTGRVSVLSGRDGSPLFVLDGQAPGDLFGRAVDGHCSAAGKLLVIGASDAGPDRRGRVHVYSPASSTAQELFRIEGQKGDSELDMMFVSIIGDVNGDGTMDVYASDWASNVQGKSGCGRVYVHSGRDGSRLHTLSGSTPGEGFGIGSAEAGDVDRDGCDDLLVGSWQHDGGAPGAGRCTLISGRTGLVLATYTCTVPGETFGFDATGLGDVNGDGAPDFLATGADSFVMGAKSGRVVIVAGPTLPGPPSESGDSVGE